MDYVTVEEARKLSGLRLVLSRGGPGPWGEAAKAFFHVKRLPYVAAAQIGGGPNPALREWTGQVTAPVAAWNDEPPVWAMVDILFLAERLAPEPALIPEDPQERAWMFGLAHELTGREGLGWSRRLCMFQESLGDDAAPDGPEGELQRRYGWSPGAGVRAAQRAVQVVKLLRNQLERQRERGRTYLIGEHLSALDLYWAAFSNLVAPMPHEQCPMPESMRAIYTWDLPGVEELLPGLVEHRDFIFAEHLTLPMDF